MFQQPIDFRDESEALYALLDPLKDSDFDRRSQFKGWTVNDVISHLHVWNRAADLSLNDSDAFADFRNRLFAAIQEGSSITEFEKGWLDGCRNRERLEQWRSFYLEMSERFADADPKLRVAWAGPDMSVRSSITARLMETWAHGQELYDLLGVERIDTDRIKNIAVLGVNTFAWTFVNRGLEVPASVPQVRLSAPSGETWTWNQDNHDDVVEGAASEFCQVVTQVRNRADTNLKVVGEVAERWISIAQCFAGPPEDPPPPGSRFRATSTEEK